MKITEKQKNFLKKHIKNLDQILLSDDVNDLLLEIDDAIVDTFDDKGNPSDAGIKLQNIYSEIFENN